jgi:hypothetical protein
MPEITGKSEFTIDFQVYCEWGYGLCDLTTVDNRRQHVIVQPCPRCIKDARSDGYDEGYRDQKEEGNG